MLDASLQKLVQIFLQENENINLSAFRTVEHCSIGNVEDSLAFVSALEQGSINISPPKMIIDIGTGGGFPLLPLAMAFPEAQCHGIDSIKKKLDAIMRIALEMEINNLHFHCGRLELFGHNPLLREQADIVTARAVAEIPVLLEYAVPLLKVGGLCAFWKSSHYADELASSLNAQKILHCQFIGKYDYDLGDEWGKRTILFFQKKAPTSEKYPREVSVPKAEPL
jgi:16S rRNA (guanine527-N7)-methyltransferase